MGGSQTVNHQGDESQAVIRVSLDSYEVGTGDDLHGTVGLLVKERLDLDTVHLEFYGETYVEWWVTHSTGKTSVTRTKISACEPTVEIKALLFVWPDGVINPGQYSLPFIVKVPDGLPSSLNWVHNDWKASITYTVSVYLTDAIRDSTEVALHQRLGLPQHELTVKRSSEVRVWCASKGQATNSAEISRPAYFVGEAIDLILKYDFSECKAGAHAYKIELKYKIRLFNGGHSRESHTGTLSTAKASCPNRAGTIEFAMQTSEGSSKLTTVLSKLVTMEFFFVITPQFRCCVCAGDLSCELMVLLSSRHTPGNSIVPPDDWNPMVLNPNSILIDEEEEALIKK
jgi:hypothetical protein